MFIAGATHSEELHGHLHDPEQNYGPVVLVFVKEQCYFIRLFSLIAMVSTHFNW